MKSPATTARPTRTSRRSTNLALAAMLALGLGSTSHAGTFYWDGSTGNWNDLTKWSTDLAGTTDPLAAPLATVSDILNFNTTPGAASTSTLYLNGTRGTSAILATMNFSGTGATTLLGGVSGTPASNDLFIAGVTLSNASGGAVTIGDTAVSPTAHVNLKAGSISFTNNSGSLLTLANGLNSYGTGSTTTFTFAGSGNILSGGVIGNGTGTNVVALSKTGAGILTLSGANTFTGGVSINGSGNGGIKITNSSSLGTHATAKTVDFNTGTIGVAELDMDPGAAGSITLSNKINFTASSNTTTGSGFVSRTGTNAIQGKITMRSGLASLAISSSSGSTLTLSGVISANVSGRSLYLGGASTNANTISGNMDNSGGFGDYSVFKYDAGTWILSGNNSYTGLTTITNGTLKFGHANAIGGSGGLTVNSNPGTIDNSSGGALVMNNVGTVTLSNNLTFGGTNDLTINSAVNQTTDLTVTMNGAGNLTFGNYANTAASNRILNVAGSSNGTLTVNNVAISNDSNSYNLRIGNNSGSNGKLNITGVISDGGTATASSLTIGGSSAGNTVTLGNANTHRGGTTLSSGTLNINNAAALGNTAGTFTINGGTIDTTVADLTTSNYPIALNGDFTFKGTNNLNLGAGAVTMGGTRVVTVTAKTLTVGGVIDDGASTFTLNKQGAGTLTLTGANTYNGNTNITVGTLILNHNPADSQPAILGNVGLSTGTSGNRPVLYLGNNNQLQSTATVSATLSGSNSVFTDFVLAGRSQTIAGYSASGRPTATSRSFIENGFLAGDSGAGVLTINNSSTVTLGGGTTANQLEIRDNNGTGGGTLALVKDGAGTMILNLYAAGYTGGFTMKNGLVQIAGTAFADTGTVSTSTPLIFEGGTLSSNGGTTRAVGAGNTVSLAGDVTLGDATNNGALSFAGAATLTGNRQLTIASGVSFSGGIGQDVAGRALTKLGDGTLTLSGTSAYSGGTTVKAGTLALGANTAAAGTGGIFIGDSSGSSTATLQVSNNISFANAITVQGSGGTKSINSTSSGATPTLTGGVTLNDNLTINNNAATSNLQFTTNDFALNGKTLTVNSNNTNAGTVTFASTAPITGTSASAINFGGNASTAGKFRLSAANTFSGTATLNTSSGGGALALELNNVDALQNATLDTGASGNQAVTFVVSGSNTYNIGALQGSDTLDIGGNTISVGSKGSSAFSADISGTGGSLTKVGASSTLTLNNSTSYTGATTVAAGVLALSGSGSLASATIDVAAELDTTALAGWSLAGGQTLKGTGTINAGAGKTVTIASGAILAPGASPGQMDVTGNLSFANTGTYQAEIQTSGSSADLVDINGNLSITSGSILTLGIFGADTSLSLGTKYALFSYSGTWDSGTFAGYADESTFTLGLNDWRINYDDTSAGVNGGIYANTLTLTVVPEPTTTAFGLLAAAGLLLRRRRA